VKVLASFLIACYFNNMEKKHGGPNRGQGRRPLQAGEDTVIVSMRMTKPQREKWKRLGSGEWVRLKIDEAKEPK
jgi:hypothetical protein